MQIPYTLLDLLIFGKQTSQLLQPFKPPAVRKTSMHGFFVYIGVVTNFGTPYPLKPETGPEIIRFH